MSRWGGGGLENYSARVGQNHASPEETLAPTGPAWLQSLALALSAVALDKLFVFSEARTAGSDGYTYGTGPCADWALLRQRQPHVINLRHELSLSSGAGGSARCLNRSGGRWGEMPASRETGPAGGAKQTAGQSPGQVAREPSIRQALASLSLSS